MKDKIFVTEPILPNLKVAIGLLNIDLYEKEKFKRAKVKNIYDSQLSK